MRLMRTILSSVAALISSSALLWAPSASAQTSCELDRPVLFGGMNWESNLVLVDVERFIIEHGYGCKTSVEPGETVAMLSALQRGDIDVVAEIWPEQLKYLWDKALASGNVEGVGHIFDTTEGWYIPRYTQERHPELKTAADLAKFAEVFKDPEDPSKGRIYGCPPGWTCANLNGNLLKALKLDGKYTMFAPGSGPAKKAAIMSAYKRKRDIVFYYWTPTPVVGSLDLVRLELPPFNEEAYACVTDPECQNPVPTELKAHKAITALNTDFTKQAPQLKTFLSNVNMPNETIAEILGWMENEGAEPRDTALYFLKKYPDVWKKWIPADAAERVQAAL